MKAYTVVFELEEDGGYSAWVPDLPGCTSQGDTQEETLANIREAIECYVEGLHKLGRPAPEARTEVKVIEVSAA